jgi:predicted dehydrogenase
MKHARMTAISECIYPGELARRQQQFDIPHAFLHYQDMLNTVELDAVVISTPHVLHFHQAKDCLTRGLHVLVDKPPAIRAEDIHTLVDLAHSKNRYFVVASQRRYDPLFRSLRDKVHSEAIGELRFVELYYGRSISANFATSWRNNSILNGGGALIDAGYHIIDSLLWITDDLPFRVWGGLRRNGSNVDTSAALTLELREGVLVNVSVHLEMPPGIIEETIGFFGSQGAVVYQRTSHPDHIPAAHLIEIHGGQHKRKDVPRNREVDQAPAKNFVGAILDQEAVLSSGQASIGTVRAIEWIYQELDRQSSKPERQYHNASRRFAGEEFH